MTLEKIQEMWREDSAIDKVNLDQAVLDTANLHSKYLEILNSAKLRLKSRSYEMDCLKRDKWLYLGGKMTKQQMDDRGWQYDPFDGCTKPLKSEIPYWLDSDKEIQELKMRIDYQQTVVDTLIDIMENIKWRNSAIRNIIDWRRFTSGD
jgi:hypothetical protein